MKRRFLIILFLFISGLAIAQPIATFDRTKQDFGDILWKEPVNTTFTITNRGNSPLVITYVSTSCGCTEATYTQEPIAVGESGQISVTYDAGLLGRFNKSVGVFTNSEDSPTYLRIIGTVCSELEDYDEAFPYSIGNVRLDMNEIIFPDGNKGEKLTTDINIINLGDTDYNPIIMHLPKYLKFEAIPAELPRKQSGILRFTVDTNLLDQLGVNQTSVYLARFLGDNISEENELIVSSTLLPDFSNLTALQHSNAPVIDLSAYDIKFGNVKGKNKNSQTVILTNKGKSDLTIQQLQVSNPALSVSLGKQTIKPGKSTKLRIRILNEHLNKRSSNMRIILISNDPKQPKSIIKVQLDQ